MELRLNVHSISGAANSLRLILPEELDQRVLYSV